MEWIFIILYSLYFGLVPFDNIKELTGDTITKTLGLIIIAFIVIYLIIKRTKSLKLNFINTTYLIVFLIYSFTYFVLSKVDDGNYIRFCFLFLLFFLSSQLSLKKEVLGKIFNYSTVIIAIISISSILLNLSLTYLDRTHYYIWNGLSVDANIYCSTLIFPVLFSLNNVLEGKGKKKILYMLMLVPMILSIFISGSRGGLLAIGVGILFLLLFNNKSKTYNKVIFIVILILLIYIIMPYLPSNIVNRLSLSAIAEDKASARFEIWEYAFNKFKSESVFYMIFGNGFLSFKNALGIRSVSHNLFVQTLIEGGIVMIMILVSLFVKIIKYFKNNNSAFMISFVVSLLIMSCSLDVIVSRFFWNSMIIICFYMNLNNRVFIKSAKAIVGEESE